MKTLDRRPVLRGALASTILLIATGPSALAAFELSLSPTTVTVEVGQNFGVWVNVVDCPAFKGAQWYVEFDDTRLDHPDPSTGQLLGTLNAAADGNLLTSDSDTTDNAATPGSGRLVGTNAGGDGTLGLFIFTATATGTATITTYNHPDREMGNRVNDGTSDHMPTIIEAQVTVTINAPTPVVMSGASARSAGVGAVVEWTTQSEIENVGFDVLRRRAGSREWRRVTGRPIEGRLTAVGPATYQHLDLAGPGRYEYCVETIAADGRRERHSDPAMTVTVRPGEVLGALYELPGLLGARAGGLLGDVRSKAVTALRRRQLAARRGRAPSAARHGRCEPTPRVRILASTAERSRAVDSDARPVSAGMQPPGGTIIRTRGDGVFFVPASALPVAPARAEFVTAGVRSLPLRHAPEGVWFFASNYRDSYTDLNATFVVERRGAGTSFPARGGHAPSGRKAVSTVVSVAGATARAEIDGMYAVGAKGCPDPWLYPRYLNDRSPEQTVDVELHDYVGGPATLRVAVYGYTHDADVDPDHELIVSVNGEAVADITWDGAGYRVFETALAEGAVREGGNLVGLTVPRTPAIPRGHGLVLDYVEVDYRRELSLTREPLALEVDGTCLLEIPGLPARELMVVQIHAWGRSSPVAVSFERRRDSYAARFRARKGYAYYVATPGQVRAPEEIAPARVAGAPEGTAYLAVGPEEFRRAMEPLLELRRAEGLPAAYVSLGEAVDTHGRGRYGADAIAALVRATSPRYVLLVGDNSYDYLDRTGLGVDPIVPAILVATSALCETNADALYGDLDGDGVPEAAVGRLPVRTVDELEALVAKIVDHSGATSGASGILVADDADRAGDFPAAQRRVAEGFPEIVWTELYLGIHGGNATVRSRLTEAVNIGTDLVVYQGHGSLSWLAEGVPVLDTAEAALWTGSPVAYLSTCWSAFIQSNTVAAASIPEVFLRSPVGPVASIGSTTPCTQRNQERLLRDFLAEALHGGKTIGEAMVSAQRRAAARAEGAFNDEARGAIMDTVRCYAVLGDPATRILEAAD